MGSRIIYYDTETTGVRPEKDRVIEIAAYDPTRDKTFAALVNPGYPIPPEATEIHKITDEMVADAPSFSEAAEKFVEFCEEEAVLIAHNNDKFDSPFLQQEFSRCGLPMPAWKSLDSLKWARKYRPDLPRHSLQFLREIYGIPANQAHRALDDVFILHQVFSRMIDDLSIDIVLSLLDKPRNISTMPFGKYRGRALAEVPKEYVQWLSKSGAFDKEENEELKKYFLEVGLLA